MLAPGDLRSWLVVLLLLVISILLATRVTQSPVPAAPPPQPDPTMQLRRLTECVEKLQQVLATLPSHLPRADEPGPVQETKPDGERLPHRLSQEPTFRTEEQRRTVLATPPPRSDIRTMVQGATHEKDLLRAFAFLSYRQVLERFGCPDFVVPSQYGVTLHYLHSDNQRLLLLFRDGLVVSASSQ